VIGGGWKRRGVEQGGGKGGVETRTGAGFVPLYQVVGVKDIDFVKKTGGRNSLKQER